MLARRDGDRPRPGTHPAAVSRCEQRRAGRGRSCLHQSHGHDLRSDRSSGGDPRRHAQHQGQIGHRSGVRGYPEPGDRRRHPGDRPGRSPLSHVRGLAGERPGRSRLCEGGHRGDRAMSNNLELAQVAAAQNQKEVTINDQAGQLDAALTEQFVADVSAGNVSLTATHYRRAVHIKATGAATSGRTVTLQAIKKLSIISNWSSTDSVDFVLGTATVTLAPAEDAATPTMALVYADGTANGLYAVSSGIGGGGGGALYDLGFYYSGGPPGASELLFKWVATRDLELAADLAGSFGDIGTNPTAPFDLDVTF